jgi:ubiquinone/menaquinone biosynthesis C-methylase UbiE
MINSNKFTETKTEELYAHVDKLCKAFWDQEGSLHWGYFENPDSTELSTQDFLPASKRWNQCMLERSGINSESRVLDIGCGNGNSALWLAQQTACEVVGIDLSSDRIANAITLAQEHPSLPLSFQKSSATQLPFPDKSFTHIWSQATLYHVHERKQALMEVYRVLQIGGKFVFDDLITPIPIEALSETAYKYVYDRILFKPLFSGESYGDFLSELGFKILQTENLDRHLYKSYELLSKLAHQHETEVKALYDSSGLDPEKYISPTFSYQKVCEAIDRKELGWFFYLCQK